MTARILDGVAVAASVKADLRARVDRLRERGRVPGLATVLVGADPASLRYVAGKYRDCAEVGIVSLRRDLPEDATQDEVIRVIEELNADESCTGYIVELPLPPQIDPDALLARVSPAKDADGLHPANLGHLVLSPSKPLSTPVPCTPRAIVALLNAYEVPLGGAEVVVIGRGLTVGRSLGLLLTRRENDATVTLTHTATRDLANHLRVADIVVAAAGVAGLVDASMVKPGAAVLDVGMSRAVDPVSGRSMLVGDVTADVTSVAEWLAPSRGGVGPMTRAMLLTNVVELAERG